MTMTGLDDFGAEIAAQGDYGEVSEGYRYCLREVNCGSLEVKAWKERRGGGDED